MKFCSISLFLFFWAINLSIAQTQIVTAENGKKVILNNNGTWKYIEGDKTSETSLVQANKDPNDCSNWIKTETDKFTGRSITTGKNAIVITNTIGNNGLRILLMLGSDNGIIFSTQIVGAGRCIEERAKIYILFTDNSKLLLSSSSKFNCKGNATIYFGGVFGNKSELEELITKKIQSMRVVTSDGYVESDFNVNNQEEFYNQINCLAK